MIVGKKPLYVCVAQRKEERRAMLVVSLNCYFLIDHFVRSVPSADK